MAERRWWLIYGASLGTLILGHLAYGGYLTSSPQTSPKLSEPITVWLQKQAPESKGLVWIDGYQDGNLVAHKSQFSRDRRSAVQQWLSQLPWQSWEVLELGLADRCENLGGADPPNQERGLWGLWLASPQSSLCFSPTYFAHQGTNLQATHAQYQSSRGVLQARKFRASVWQARPKKGQTELSQLQWQACPQGEPVQVGASLTWGTLEQITHQLAAYQQRQVERHHGLLPYRLNIADNRSQEQERILVRNCLGSWSLARYARFTGKPEDQKISARHLACMATRYAHWDGHQAYLADNDICYLGSQALFGLALQYQPQLSPHLQQLEKGIAASIAASLQPEGYFRTTVRLPGSAPVAEAIPDKDPNQDFFPGETMTYLAQRGDLALFEKAFPYYEGRFKRLPHPAAVPWLTQACALAYFKKPNPRWAEFAFSCTDWLLDELQPFEKAPEALRGAPVNPEKTRIGSVSASSGAGVQLEGLVQAYELAVKCRDSTRQERYLKAIQEVSRYLWQMQIRDSDQLYWLPKKLRSEPLGGIRDLPWDYRIQIDSTAHTLNAWIKLLELHPAGWQ